MTTIVTDRLVLRDFEMSDIEKIHPLFCDHEAMRLVGMLPAFTAMEQTEERIGRWIEYKKHLAITDKETGDVMGYIIINSDPADNREDSRKLGYALKAECRNKGYMQETVRAVIEELRKFKIRYVCAGCFKENNPSEQLIRKLGFELQHEGTYKARNDTTYETLEFRMDLLKEKDDSRK